MTDTKFFYEVKTDLTAGQKYVLAVNENDKRAVNYKAFNHLVIHNASNKLVQIQLNEDTNQKYPIVASGGTMAFNVEDEIKFHSLSLINPDESNAVTGDIYITWAYINKEA